MRKPIFMIFSIALLFFSVGNISAQSEMDTSKIVSDKPEKIIFGVFSDPDKEDISNVLSSLNEKDGVKVLRDLRERVVSEFFIERGSFTNAGQAAQGLIPGVLIYDSELSGSYPFTMIRSLTGPGGQPLILLDGFPIEGDLAGINPHDIASITYLRDASSLAIFGSAAAGGAILITTKQADSKDFKLRFTTRHGISNLAFSAPGYTEAERTGYRQDYYLSGGAKREKFSYFLSTGYLNEATPYDVFSFDRLTARANFTFSPTEWFDGVANLSGAIYDRHQNSGRKSTNDLLMLNFYLPAGFTFTMLGDLEARSSNSGSEKSSAVRELYQAILDWNREISEDHSIGAYAGWELYISKYRTTFEEPFHEEFNSWFSALNYQFRKRLSLDLSICKTMKEDAFSYSAGATYLGDRINFRTTYGRVGEHNSFTLGFDTKLAGKIDLSAEYFNNQFQISSLYNPTEISRQSSNGVELSLFSNLLSRKNLNWELGLIGTWIAKHKDISLPPVFGSIVSSLDWNRFHTYTLITLGAGHQVESAGSYLSRYDKNITTIYIPDLYNATNACLKQLYFEYDLSDKIFDRPGRKFAISLSVDNLLTLRASDQVNPYAVAGTHSYYFLPVRSISLGLNVIL